MPHAPCPAQAPYPCHCHAVPMPCPQGPIFQGAAAVVAEQGKSSIQETIHGKGRGGRVGTRAPSQPILAAWSDFFIKLNIGIDLDNLTTRTALPCPACHAACERRYG